MLRNKLYWTILQQQASGKWLKHLQSQGSLQWKKNKGLLKHWLSRMPKDAKRDTTQFYLSFPKEDSCMMELNHRKHNIMLDSHLGKLQLAQSLYRKGTIWCMMSRNREPDSKSKGAVILTKSLDLKMLCQLLQLVPKVWKISMHPCKQSKKHHQNCQRKSRICLNLESLGITVDLPQSTLYSALSMTTSSCISAI